jgi:hypothetical protein
VAGGAARVLPVSLNCPLPLRRTHPLTLVCCVCFCSNGSNQHKIWAGGGKSVFIWEAGWEEPFRNNSGPCTIYIVLAENADCQPVGFGN